MAVAFERGEKPTLLTVAEAATIAGVGRGTIRGWCSRGELPSVEGRTRADRLIRRTDLERYVASLASSAGAGLAPEVTAAQPASDRRRRRTANTSRSGWCASSWPAETRSAGSPRRSAARSICRRSSTTSSPTR